MYTETGTAGAITLPLSRDPNTISGIDALSRMISYRRPSGSKSERNFIKKWLLPLGCEPDDYGNLVLRIGSTNVMWSSHTDTVHREGGIQKVICVDGLVQLARSEKRSTCLGADCTAGVWLMREMILAGKPGLYIFHRDEEIGGHGSMHIATNRRDLIEGIDIAIALDRKGTTSVITYQFDRCCSDAFGNALAAALGSDWRTDDGGIFTDTANYTGLIPECTNLSVGMEHCHTSKETLDLDFVMELRNSLIALDTGNLPVVRDPAAADDVTWIDFVSDRHGYADMDRNSRMSLYDLVREFPDEVADFLEGYGVDVRDVINHIDHANGTRRRYACK